MGKLADADLATLADKQVRLIMTSATMRATYWFSNYSLMEFADRPANICQGFKGDIFTYSSGQHQ